MRPNGRRMAGRCSIAVGAMAIAAVVGGSQALGQTEPTTTAGGTQFAARMAKDPLEGARAVLTRVNDDLVYRLVVRDLAVGAVQPLALGVRAHRHRGQFGPPTDRKSPSSPQVSTSVTTSSSSPTGSKARGRPASARRVVAVTDENAGPPFWSPDGRLLSFDAYDRQSRPVIYRVNVDGSHLARIVPPPLGRRLALDDSGFSPDGRQLLYVEWRRMGRSEEGVGPALLKAVPATGGHPRTIVDGRRDKKDAYIWQATWSPDGRLIAYMNSCWLPESQGICRLAVVKRDGTGKTQLPMRGSERGEIEWGGLSFAWRPHPQALTPTANPASATQSARPRSSRFPLARQRPGSPPMSPALA